MLVLLGATLLLPVRVAFNAPMLPAFGRETISTLCAAIGCLLFARRQLAARLPGTGVDCLALVLIVGGCLTAFVNPDPLYWGPRVLPGLTPYDGVSMAVEHVLTLWIPFYLGRVFFRRPQDLRILLLWVIVAAALYSVLVLVELIISPRIHRIFYGYYAMHYVAAHRWGGWRPTVFMEHVLALSMFMLSAALGAVGLARARLKILRIPAWGATAYLTLVFVLCKGLGSLVLGLVALPIAIAARPRLQLWLASAFVALTFAYPLLRTAQLVPTDAMVEIARGVGTDRAASLKVRFDNEDRLLAWARKRIWLGWGKWARHRVFDPKSGRDITITDGYWIIKLGQQGIVGFGSGVGLLIVPVWVAAARLRRVRSSRDRVYIATTALIVTAYGVDLLPNTQLTPLSILIAGALAGAMEGVPTRARRPRVLRESPGRYRPVDPEGMKMGDVPKRADIES
jgi:hypothetical protein